MKLHIYLPVEMVKFSVIILLATGDFLEKVSFFIRKLAWKRHAGH